MAVDKPKSRREPGSITYFSSSKIEKVFDHGEKKYVLVVVLDEHGDVNVISVKVREYPIYPYSNFVDYELRIERQRGLTVEYSTCSDSWGRPRVQYKQSAIQEV